MKENITIIDNLINERLKQVRSRLQLTQGAFSKILEVKQSYYSDVENGKREVTTKLIKNLVEIWHISPNWIFTGEGNFYITNVDSNISVNKASNDESEGVKSDSQNHPTKQVELMHSRKLYRLLEQQHPELYKFKIAFDNLISFADVIQEIDQVIGEKLRHAFWEFDGKFDFKTYQNNSIKTLNELSMYAEPILNFNIAINRFYNELQSIPDNKIPFDDYIIE